MVRVMRPCHREGCGGRSWSRAGAIRIDILDLQEGVADMLDVECVAQLSVFKNFAEIKAGSRSFCVAQTDPGGRLVHEECGPLPGKREPGRGGGRHSPRRVSDYLH